MSLDKLKDQIRPKRTGKETPEVDLTGFVSRKELRNAFRLQKDAFNKVLNEAYENKHLTFDPKGVHMFKPLEIMEILRSFGHPYAEKTLR